MLNTTLSTKNSRSLPQAKFSEFEGRSSPAVRMMRVVREKSRNECVLLFLDGHNGVKGKVDHRAAGRGGNTACHLTSGSASYSSFHFRMIPTAV